MVGFGDALCDFQFLDRLFENLNATRTITGIDDNGLTGFGQLELYESLVQG